MPIDLKPDLYIQSVYQLDIEILKKKQIQGIIIDIDNTLVSWDTCEPDEICTAFIQMLLSNGFKLCILSNARKKRVALFNRTLSLPALHNAFKPFKGAFTGAMKRMGTTAADTAVIGDQLFTDILGGKRLGLFTILVAPISSKEFLWTKFMRRIEKRFLKTN